MLELVALYFILKEAGRLAVEKGYNPIRWRVHAFMVWFIGEFVGISIVLTYFPNQLVTTIVIGVSMAYLSYLMLKKYWDTLPSNPQDHD